MQDYNINTPDQVVGELYGISLTNSVRQSYINLDGAGQGLPVAFGRTVRAVAGHDRRAINGQAGSTGTKHAVKGITMRQINQMQQMIPGDGTIWYQAGDAMAVLEAGMISVNLETDTAVAGAFAFVDLADGTFHGAAGAGRIEATNVVFKTSGSAGDIVVVTITQANMQPVA